MKKEYKVCTGCEIHHIENCESCLGFGVYADGHGVVRALDALEKSLEGDVIPCPECGSTENGLPK